MTDKDLSRAGATGGGYILSRGVVTKVIALGEAGPTSLEIAVNGDAKYEARTTRAALKLMLENVPMPPSKLVVEQQVDVPIGFGFGASAASALSAVFATSAALGSRIQKEHAALYAHEAEIIQQTGLGTVSAAYDGVGAGVVYEPGAPGVAKFMNVNVPRGLRIVTAALAPWRLSGLLSSRRMVAQVSRLGSEALGRVVREPTIERMAKEGEWFTRRLGMMTPEVRSLVRSAISAGAIHASQNMLGQAMHALVPSRRVAAVVKALNTSALGPRVDVFEIGTQRAGVTSVAELRYPTVTSSLA